jgi:hypothetical protein
MSAAFLNTMKQLYHLPDEVIIDKIYVVRGLRVMVDKDLAELYGVETKRLKEQVKRNIKRFPEDFMFILGWDEYRSIRSQNATLEKGRSKYRPMVFTEQGVAMLSSVLNSERAISVNIQIIRVFTKMRQLIEAHKEILRKIEMLEKKDIDHDEKIALIFNYLRQLQQAKEEDTEFRSRRRIGSKARKIHKDPI